MLFLTTGCSRPSEQPTAIPRSKFSQAALDAIADACGIARGSLLMDGANSVRFGSAIAGDYKKLNCVQTKIREAYLPGAKAAVVGSEKTSEGDNAQAH